MRKFLMLAIMVIAGYVFFVNPSILNQPSLAKSNPIVLQSQSQEQQSQVQVGQNNTGSSACPNPYTVQSGDLLSVIATRCNTTVDALVAANQISNPNLIYPGQKLAISGSGGNAVAQRTAPQVQARSQNVQPANSDTGIISINKPDPFVKNILTDADYIALVSVEGGISWPVTGQNGNFNYVSTASGVVTQDELAAHYAVDGIVAHNFLEGANFFNLSKGQKIEVTYKNGNKRLYVINDILSYQALSPSSPYSDFVDLTNPGAGKMTSGQVFKKIYELHDGQQAKLVLQTCIDANGDSSWGRIFIIATPSGG